MWGVRGEVIYGLSLWVGREERGFFIPGLGYKGGGFILRMWYEGVEVLTWRCDLGRESSNLKPYAVLGHVKAIHMKMKYVKMLPIQMSISVHSRCYFNITKVCMFSTC